MKSLNASRAAADEAVNQVGKFFKELPTHPLSAIRGLADIAREVSKAAHVQTLPWWSAQRLTYEMKTGVNPLLKEVGQGVSEIASFVGKGAKAFFDIKSNSK